MSKSISKKHIAVALAFLFLGFGSVGQAKRKKKIKLPGVKTIAVLPFTYAPLSRDFSKVVGTIAAEEMQKMLVKKKCPYQFTDRDTVDKVIAQEKIDLRKPLPDSVLVSLGKKLGVDAVLAGDLKDYDELEKETFIPEGLGGGYTENLREVRITFDLKIVRVKDGSVAFHEEIKKSDLDRRKDPMQPSSPEILTARIARAVAKKLAKRMK